MLQTDKMVEVGPRLGDFVLEQTKFSDQPPRGDRLVLHRWLLEQIQLAPRESYLLSAVIDAIASIRDLIDPGYSFMSFEKWLNEESGLSRSEQLKVRGKIVGRYIPREDYQVFFPIGLGRTHPGPHFATAHNPPDLDTTVASFWGWVDSFAARVSAGPHIWNLPGKEQPAQIRRLIDQLVGPGIWKIGIRQSGHLAVLAGDLATRKGLELHHASALTTRLDHHRFEKFILAVDQEGYFQGCWRASDVEGFRTVVLILTDCWRWFATSFHRRLIGLLSRDRVARDDVAALVTLLFTSHIENSEALGDVAEEQKGFLDLTLKRVFGVAGGLGATFEEFARVLVEANLSHFGQIRPVLSHLVDPELYSEEGILLEGRTPLFQRIEKIVEKSQLAIQEFRGYVDQLGIAMQIKNEVFGNHQQYVTVSADLDEIRAALGPHHFVAVVEPVGKQLLPVGVVTATEIQRRALGTTSLRDFCNRDETKIADHLEIISVVDHHRSALDTTSFPTAILGDVQSCNTLLAEQSMLLNDRYSLGGMTPEAALEGGREGEGFSRLAQRRLQRAIAASTRGDYFVHPRRELTEYLSYIYAILDDTDLLSRVTSRDVVAIASLLNRLKSLILGTEVEVISLEDLPRDETFPKAAAERILQNSEMYSLYSKIYAVREAEVTADLVACAEGRASTIFADTKEQKGCARVGQTKLFPNNFPQFINIVDKLRREWVEKAQEVFEERPELQLHIQMVSTIAGAEEVYQRQPGNYSHQDEVWLWVPELEEGYQRLASFLGAFKGAKEVRGNQMSLALLGENCDRLAEIFTHHFGEIEVKAIDQGIPMAVLYCRAGSINSRKTAITPYLPS
jgi:hypothetical protein